MFQEFLSKSELRLYRILQSLPTEKKLAYRFIARRLHCSQSEIRQFIFQVSRDLPCVYQVMQVTQEEIIYIENEGVFPWILLQMFLYKQPSLFLLNYLLEKKICSYEELLMEFYWSRSNLKRKLHQISLFLERFQLSLECRNAVEIVGSEKNQEWLYVCLQFLINQSAPYILKHQSYVCEESADYFVDYRLTPRGKEFLFKQIIGLEKLDIDEKCRCQLIKRLRFLEKRYPLEVREKDCCCRLLYRMYLYQKYIQLKKLSVETISSQAQHQEIIWQYLSSEFVELSTFEKENSELSKYFQYLFADCINLLAKDA